MMTIKRTIYLASIASAVILCLMILFRNAQSELFTSLSFLLAGTIFYTLLYVLYKTDRFRQPGWWRTFEYVFFGLSIPLLVTGIELTSEQGHWVSDLFGGLLAIIILYLVGTRGFRFYQRIAELRNEKAKAELVNLKHQVNPHFFFNALNALYSLITKDPVQAQAYVLKLSELMRFSVYEGGKAKVTLGEEIAFLRNFAELNADRYQKTVDVIFEESIEDTSKEIVPLLLIMLMENAFKHGVEKLTEEAFVRVKIDQKGNQLHFEIRNNIPPGAEMNTSGLGLKNLRRRLEISYPGDGHHLEISINNDVYCVQLSLVV